MKVTQSAGVLLCRNSGGEFQVLLGHATHKNTLSITDRRWTILKGKVEEGESLWAAAKREFLEESSFDINYEKFESFAEDKDGKPLPFYQYQIVNKEKGEKGKKLVNVFCLYDTLNLVDVRDLLCTSKIRDSVYPEIDGHMWTNLKAARLMIMPSQLGVIDKVKKIHEIF
jgi:predicted NUDIX family NTP pyrophosphohydrolase